VNVGEEDIVLWRVEEEEEGLPICVHVYVSEEDAEEREVNAPSDLKMALKVRGGGHQPGRSESVC
jgi:hypothetical protein